MPNKINLDEFLTWVKYVYEVCDTDYFRLYIFEKKSIQEVENILLYLDYLNLNSDIKQFYSETINHIPELIISIQEVRENKIMLEKAEKALK